MNPIQIIVGSMLGGTEYVAEACEQTLNELGFKTTLHLSPSLEEIPYENQTWLVCTSTHGAGDYPDNLLEFANAVNKQDPVYQTTSLLVIGVGDTNYDTFCFAAKNLNKLLISKGCKPIIEPLYLDMAQDIDPEEMAQQWIETNKDHLS
ncbi:flavodoxin domain-containing protein [Thalassotalea euphylliae]|uniref:flavodoxin domain-containing protein n=1 Tax=Thalassotalea euphylliae TaxID=1655234 RepID=UPI00362C383B